MAYLLSLPYGYCTEFYGRLMTEFNTHKHTDTCLCMYTAHANTRIGEKTRMRERDLKLLKKTETGALREAFSR